MMNINELEKLAIAHAGLTSWQCNAPADETIQLIAAYRESVSALERCYDYRYCLTVADTEIVDSALDTAMRLGIKLRES